MTTLESKRTRADVSGRHVLLVSDAEDWRAALVRELERAGATVVLAADFADAFRILERDAPDALVSTVVLLRGDEGFKGKVARVIQRARYAKPGIVALAVTPVARTKDLPRVEELGFTGHLPMPCAPAEVLRELARLLGERGVAADRFDERQFPDPDALDLASLPVRRRA
jgi:CheY-like chemotaxis protein